MNDEAFRVYMLEQIHYTLLLFVIVNTFDTYQNDYLHSAISAQNLSNRSWFQYHFQVSAEQQLLFSL